ncbi:PLC-like phosphodiesterase [Pisolithus marmoratus]|nr:PLC-like phosphodiesterase [Pisolithus marmoratus]
MTITASDKRNYLQTTGDNPPDRPSAPRARGSASLSENFSTVRLQVTNDGPWITRNLENFPESLFDNMLQASLVDCVDDTGSSDKHTVTRFVLNGQATNLFPVTSKVLSCEDCLVAKVFWEEMRKGEPKILKKVYEIAERDEDVKGHIPDIIYCWAFRDTSTAVIRSRLGLKTDGARIQYLILFRKLKPIIKLVGTDFLHTWWATVKCHLALCKNDIYHRDVSSSNLMYKQIADGTIIGVLNELDMALIKDGPTGTVCTGTVPFMGLALLSERGLGGQITHSYEHDVESFIWSLTWVTLRYDNGVLRTTGRPLDEWLAVDALSCRKKKIAFLHEGRRELTAGMGHEVNLQVAHECMDVLGLATSIVPFSKAPSQILQFKQADSQRSGFFDFTNFQKFVKLLKACQSSAFMRDLSTGILLSFKAVEESSVSASIRLNALSNAFSVDIYDGDNEPMVFYGKTLASKVRVREVYEAISKYAFVTSPYPVIISAEVHCSVAQQDMLVAIMHEVFGEALVSAATGEHPKIDKLPSPEELKGKVFLKVCEESLHFGMRAASYKGGSPRYGVVFYRGELRRVKTQNIEAIKELKEEFRKAHNIFNRVRGYHQVPKKSVITALVGVATAASTAIAEPSIKSEKQDTKVKMSAALVALLVYTISAKCRGINKKENYASEHVFSLSENTANKIMKQGMVDLIKHNRDHLVRMYPKGLRFSSTNYLPHRYWAAGAQLVALNWQTFEAPCLPDKGVLARRTPHHLDVTIISAEQLPCPKDSTGHEIIGQNIVDRYVEVSIYTPDWTHFFLSIAVFRFVVPHTQRFRIEWFRHDPRHHCPSEFCEEQRV